VQHRPALDPDTVIAEYRSDAEVSGWAEHDPVDTYLALLRDHGLVDDEFLDTVEADGEAVAERMRAALYGAPAGDPLEMFDHVYAQRTPQLNAQRTVLAAELAAEREEQ
jgi:pyruvate dehydrogenase E1 component alpha subunit